MSSLSEWWKQLVEFLKLICLRLSPLNSICHSAIGLIMKPGELRSLLMFSLCVGKPAAPSNCAIHNQTADSVRVDCQEAFDGGLQQTFGLELVDRNTRTLRYVFNNTKPVFTVYGLVRLRQFISYLSPLINGLMRISISSSSGM